jgi:hypothetical protein
MIVGRTRGAAVTAVAIAAVTLGACGVSGNAHVIGPGPSTTTTVATTAATTVPLTVPASTPTLPTVPITAPPPPTTTTVPSVDPQSVAQIDQELNALDNSLNQAQSDLSSPNASDR